MSSGGFHVHGPHDHAVEHATQGHSNHAAEHSTEAGGVSSMNKIAMFTAIVATVGAIFSYMGGATQANAGLLKNDAAIKKTEASNQWNYFQSKSTKQSLAELARDLAPDDRKAGYQTKIERYETEKNEIKVVAEKLEADAHEFDHKSELQMHQHHRWAQATTALQVAIALAAIALLTRKKWLEYGMYGVAALGLGVGVMAALHI
jgi:Na+/glutamate symporter